MSFPIVFMILVLTSGHVEVKQTTDQRCKSVVVGLAEGRVMLLENPDSGRREGIQHAVCVSQEQLDKAVGARASL